MSDGDRERWDARYATAQLAAGLDIVAFDEGWGDQPDKPLHLVRLLARRRM